MFYLELRQIFAKYSFYITRCESALKEDVNRLNHLIGFANKSNNSVSPRNLSNKHIQSYMIWLVIDANLYQSGNTYKNGELKSANLVRLGDETE